MDYSQLLEIRKKYKTVQRQNAKSTPGDQTKKPAFNQDYMGKGFDNGAVDYYMVKGLTELYKGKIIR